MSAFTFDLDGEPVGKGRPRFTKTGRAYTPKATRDYELRVAAAAAAAAAAEGFGCAQGAVEVDVVAVKGRPKAKPKRVALDAWRSGESVPCTAAPDVDNIAKAILDGLQLSVPQVFETDGQVARLSVVTLYAAKGQAPGVTVRVRAL